MNKIFFAIPAIIFLFVLTCPATAQMGPQYRQDAFQTGAPVGLQIVDVTLVRPLCVAGSIVSTAAFVVIAPLAYVMGVAEPAARVLVEAPWRFTAFRYVGQFDHYTDEKPIMGVWELRPQY